MSGWCFPQQKQQQCNKALLQQMLYLWICFLIEESAWDFSHIRTTTNPRKSKRNREAFSGDRVLFVCLCGAGRGGVSILMITPGSIYFRHIGEGPPVPVIWKPLNIRTARSGFFKPLKEVSRGSWKNRQRTGGFLSGHPCDCFNKREPQSRLIPG
jgi:hypothetical protein